MSTKPNEETAMSEETRKFEEWYYGGKNFMKGYQDCARAAWDFRSVEIADLKAQLEQAEREKAELRWIPVEEKLPELAQNVLICSVYSSGPQVVQAQLQELSGMSRQWWWNGLWIDPERVTHWMPLPKPPRILSPSEGGKKEG